MRRDSRREYLCKIHGRYGEAAREAKRKILDEFCEVTGYNRKYALRLLNAPLKKDRLKARRRRSASYGPEVI